MPKSIDHHSDEEDYYYLAPETQRPFNAGLKRKRVEFVPASTEPTTITTSQSTPPSSSTAAKYLSIVLGTRATNSNPTLTSTPTPIQSLNPNENQNINPEQDPTPNPTEICETCNQPIHDPKIHESSIAHQIGLEHSHPPSHLDRSRIGLRYLEGYGWDPDERLGLGKRRDGIRVPVKAREKRDTAGLGLFSGDPDEVAEEEQKERPVLVRSLNAKQTRRMEDEKRRKAEKLRKAFYGEDLSRYLGPDG